MLVNIQPAGPAKQTQRSAILQCTDLCPFSRWGLNTPSEPFRGCGRSHAPQGVTINALLLFYNPPSIVALYFYFRHTGEPSPRVRRPTNNKENWALHSPAGPRSPMHRRVRPHLPLSRLLDPAPAEIPASPWAAAPGSCGRRSAPAHHSPTWTPLSPTTTG